MAPRDSIDIRQTSHDTPPTLLHCLLKWERERPDAVYLTQPLADGTVADYTWREVADQARRMAAYLRGRNYPPGSSIAILGKNSAHWMIADLAIWMAGHVSVPVYSTANAETVSYVLDHSEAKLMFVGRLDGDEKGWLAVASGVASGFPLINLPLSARREGEQWDAIVAATPPLDNVAMPDPAALATIIYTSGSTGTPKGVMHSFRTMCEVPRLAAVIINNGRGASHDDRMLSYLPLAHCAERQGVESLSLCYGFRVYFSHDLTTFAADLHRARPTIFLSVPRLWIKFYQAVAQKISPRKQRMAFRLPLVSGLLKKKLLAALGLDQVATAFTGSAALPTEVITWYRNLGLELLDGYGMTENYAYSHFNRPGGSARIGYVGPCLPGVEARLSEEGEILVKSPGLMMGYYKASDDTADCFTPDGFLRTGDRGQIDDQGYLRIIGRVKDQFKTAKGKYVAPVPIEAKLGEHPRMESVCVTGPGRSQPFVLATLNEETRRELAQGADRDALAGELEQLLDEVNARLEPHERLDRIVVLRDAWTIERGQMTPTMKIRRAVIENDFLWKSHQWDAVSERVVFDQ
ncbi:Long-chain-fatty-acid--CoA ligase FadD15 [Cupriavidus laharis]|uniref:Long-chain-fatty-acid--CoA ligase FadD15 n=1 Tax=Cupriavidus laharis TaxID=151654 RepID=A0ABN7Y686_9BURK|nr:AMP-binding protein [Cupriavidus laharis]CAG9167926.1 Long-chain-fatty-acid--CoA ligase FadD15 [Cupriavidus laharis]